jgi:hypothetical protein
VPGGQHDGRRLLGDGRRRERADVGQVERVAGCGHAVDQAEVHARGRDVAGDGLAAEDAHRHLRTGPPLAHVGKCAGELRSHGQR